MSDVTLILNQIDQGNSAASEQLLPLVYEELRILAASRLAHEKPGQTLQPTALVHEAYLRLVGSDQNGPHWDGRGHFFAAAAEAMRRILIDRARNKSRMKRSGKRQRVDLENVEFAIDSSAEDILAIDNALERFKQKYPDGAELVKLRFFGGLTLAEAARVVGVSPRTANRAWAHARAWLYRELTT